MKNRNTVFTAILSVLACFAFFPKVQAACGVPDGGCANFNLAEGQNALLGLTAGQWNTALGVFTLSANAEGSFNTAVGTAALISNTGNRNTAVGAGTLVNNVTGGSNTAVGTAALQHSNVGGLGVGLNTAVGDRALFSSTTGAWNVAVGANALQDNLSGTGNVAVGLVAGSDVTDGDFNIFIGQGAGTGVTTASHVICIDADGANTDNTCAIGQIFGRPSSGGSQVFVNASGILGTSTSSRHYKEDIKPMDKASEALYALKPVTFRYKKMMDPTGIRQFGLVAEDVEEVNSDLVVRDKDGKVNSVRYDQVNAMLLNEFLKEHRKVEELQATVAQQQKGIEVLTAQFKQQAAQIQKVSAQLEVNKPAAKVVLSNP
jgi:trimeric autotransporter adhesin